MRCKKYYSYVHRFQPDPIKPWNIFFRKKCEKNVNQKSNPKKKAKKTKKAKKAKKKSKKTKKTKQNTQAKAKGTYKKQNFKS